MSSKGPGSKGAGVSGGGLKARISSFKVMGDPGKMFYRMPGSQNSRKGFSKKERVRRRYANTN